MAEPLVGIVMGSTSDWETMKNAAKTLEEFGVAYEAKAMSAHRSPQLVAEWASGAAQRGMKVIIAAAGGAAHLAGVVAAHSDLPVLGIPLDNPPLGGLDALLATVQMPGGVPVATFGAGAGGPVNAALFAARVLALSDPALATRLEKARAAQREKVLEKDAALQARKR
jgi:5-(carboxyamino)imidazole ribonucleotide mutase